MTTISATLQILAFLGTASLVFCALAAAVVLAMRGYGSWASRALSAGAVIAVLYIAVLMIAGAISSSRTIAVGQSKIFCEIDCHIEYQVTGLRRTDDTVIVSVREQFDESSISPSRGDGALYPGSRRFALVSASGSKVRPVAIAIPGGEPLFSPLRPGEFHRAELRFVVPSETNLKGLLVEDDSPVSPLLIGHERSFLHKKTLLATPVSQGFTIAR